ncbi:MAG: V-type ATP synthase subunit F [ANME-2 cluster archaeon HR1]|jgi:V/A-type H+-transporting ATPase subunit F|nr:MAG: V/A-type H+-transporting ATPase subunit F [ANME-2 cluster archaeon]KAF5429055.1 V/A-type H+-transporting ATPase subunit F [ANME-2 cluster archaeon]PPA79766.1 MAG: V-type ATP synthase subunit F [ANME-2 cluster archaeon HR1]
MEIAVVGKSEFTLGFRMAGVKKILETNGDDLVPIIRNILKDKDVGVLVIHNDDMAGLPEKLRITLDELVTPTTITIGGAGESSNLRDKIKQAVGVDLWK